MKIDKIKKMSNNKYKLHLSNDEKVTTYDEVIIKNNLLFNNEIDSSLLNKIELDTKYYDLYNQVINYIAIRMRSKKEINNYLEKHNILEEDKEKIINQLLKIGLIDDAKFAKAYINDKINLSNYGPLKIKKDLYDHEISADIIETAISNIDDAVVKEKINKLINKKAKANKKYSNYQLKQKLLLELVNLGYDKEIIVQSFDGLSVSNNNIINKQYEKIYNRLSKKYSDKELYYKIKQQLYQKGFDMNEIESLINEKVENF